ncbi:MAG TPA: pyridoxamine 5'-phosphate oxidase family protein [Bacillota bacterium]|nr:pyridoxamine 5'-phosphate oxidase family protein [Bacillota bacterium]
MISEKFLQVLSYEGAAAFVTQGQEEPHLVNTWNSYIQVKGNNKIYFPAGGMKTTEENITKDNRVVMSVGCREVEGFHGPGTGFRIKGTAAFLTSGSEFEEVKQRFPWARAVVEITTQSIEQML